MERIVVWHRLLPSARDEDDPPTAALAWTRDAVARLRTAGGEVLGTMGGAVLAAFDMPDLPEAIDLALQMLDEAEAGDPPVRVVVGVGLGEVEAVTEPGGGLIGWSGTAIDRAQHLAYRARPGELVLDAEARDAASSLYLFGRQVGTGAASLRGQSIDRNQPRREACRRFIRHLRPAPVAPLTEQLLAPMRPLMRATGTQRVVLRGPPGAGATAWMAALEREIEPPIVLRIPGVPAGLEPLGSFRRALCRKWGPPARVAGAVDAMGIDKRSVERLMRIATGEAVGRADAVEALQKLLGGAALGGQRPWIVLDPVTSVDPATLTVIGSALAGNGTHEVVVVARLGLETQLPDSLARGEPVTEFVIPAMRSPDARAVAEVVLGEEPGSDVARRVAVLGGDTPLGVEEAARTLVASGDLVYTDRRFVWRIGPRSGVRAIPTEALIDERLSALEAAPHRVLEAACITPFGTSPSIVRRVARADGLSDATCDAAVERLRLEAFLMPETDLQPTSETLRQVVIQSMPPARSAELHRFLAEALSAEPHGGFASATIGYCLAEGGQGREGAKALLEAARSALDAGLARSAIRLAAAAVQSDPSQETRVAAAAVSRSLSSRPPPIPNVPAPPGASGSVVAEIAGAAEGDGGTLHDLVQRTIRAMIARDFDAAERFIDMAIAEGCDRPAADRLRAIAHLARGDHGAAMQALARTHDGEVSDRRRAARSALTRALVLMHAGEPSDAIRSGLRALSTARSLRDPRGEAAALHILSACYRSLSRPEDAEAIEDASPA